MKNNNKLSTAILLTLALYASSITYSVATPLLYGYCGGASQCITNGINSPTTNSPPIDFGFTVTGGSYTGELFVDILVPNHELKPVNFVITGTGTNLSGAISFNSMASLLS